MVDIQRVRDLVTKIAEAQKAKEELASLRHSIQNDDDLIVFCYAANQTARVLGISPEVSEIVTPFQGS